MADVSEARGVPCLTRVMRSASVRSRNLGGSIRRQQRANHLWSTDSFLNVLTMMIGIGKYGYRWIYLVRCFFIVCHWYGALHTVVYCYFDCNETDTALILQWASCASYVYTSLHAHLIYVWRLRAGRLETRNAHLDRPTLAGFAMILCWYAGMSYELYLEVEGSPYPIPKTLFYLGEASFLVTQLVNTTIFIEIAVRVHVEAARIGELVSGGACGDRDCSEVSSTCTRLSNTFNFPISMLHLEYFVSLLILIPVRGARIGSSEGMLWDMLNTPRQILEFLIIVRSGDRILGNRRKMRKLLKKTAVFLSPKVNEVRTFAQEDCGLIITMGSSLSYRSFWDFISVCWGFSLMVLQIGLDRSKK